MPYYGRNLPDKMKGMLLRFLAYTDSINARADGSINARADGSINARADGSINARSCKVKG